MCEFAGSAQPHDREEKGPLPQEKEDPVYIAFANERANERTNKRTKQPTKQRDWDAGTEQTGPKARRAAGAGKKENAKDESERIVTSLRS